MLIYFIKKIKLKITCSLYKRNKIDIISKIQKTLIRHQRILQLACITFFVILMIFTWKKFNSNENNLIL